LSLALLCYSIIALAGCTTLTQQRNPQNLGVLEPQLTVKFSDLPVPVGFKLIPVQSYSFETQGVRVAMLRYHGKSEISKVVNFYKEQMQIYGWNLLNVIEYGQHILNFDRDSETCVIILESQMGKTLVTISLGPKAQMPKKAEKPVK
jgi:hypothetical protein